MPSFHQKHCWPFGQSGGVIRVPTPSVNYCWVFGQSGGVIRVPTPSVSPPELSWQLGGGSAVVLPWRVPTLQPPLPILLMYRNHSVSSMNVVNRNYPGGNHSTLPPPHPHSV